jgi:hypothetical protein
VKVIVSYDWPVSFILRCRCGFATTPFFTLEAAGRAADLHMAEKFPIATVRRPCDRPEARALPPVAAKQKLSGMSPTEAFTEGQKILKERQK